MGVGADGFLDGLVSRVQALGCLAFGLLGLASEAVGLWGLRFGRPADLTQKVQITDTILEFKLKDNIYWGPEP